MGLGDLILPDSDFGSLAEVTPYDKNPFYFDYINNGILERITPRKKRYFRPSGNSSCKRCLFLELSGVGDGPPSLDGQKRMDSGTSIHDKWEEYFRQSGLFVMMKKRFWWEDPRVSGEPDILAINPRNKLAYQIELKSRDSFAFDKQAHALPKNKNQWNLYFWLLKMNGIELAGGWVHYEDMNQQNWKAFPMIPDFDWIDEYIGILREIQDLVDNGGEMPGPRITYTPKLKKPKPCGNCTAVLARMKGK